ncbi:hypothetical protein BC828DRAFT_372173 [Blastocladiella britannica]|nr:hypothetical protein BC828DRAFT_372173 [Blastocladiella britannica]
MNNQLAAPPHEDQYSTSYFQDDFLAHHKLTGLPSAEKALEYFWWSQFIDPTPIAGHLKFHPDPHNVDTSNMVGEIASVTHADVPGQRFHFLKEFQFGPGLRRSLAQYYSVGKNVFQAPDIASIVAARLESCVYHVRKAYEALDSMVKYDPSLGPTWERAADASDPGAAIPPATASAAVGGSKVAASVAAKSRHPAVAASTTATAAAAPGPDVPSGTAGATAFPPWYHDRVWKVIYNVAAQRHLKLDPIPEPDDDILPADTAAAAAANATDDDAAKQVKQSTPLTAAPPTTKKRRIKRERGDGASDAGSLGGESTVSRKRRKLAGADGSKRSSKSKSVTGGAAGGSSSADVSATPLAAPPSARS